MLHIPTFIEKDRADQTFEELKKLPWMSIEWKKGSKLPRLVYRYDPSDNIPILQTLSNLIETECKVTVIGIFCNLYRNGADYTPYHRDSYNQGKTYMMSFGESRTLLFKKGKDKALYFNQNHGDLFFFDSDTNRQYKHSIPKRKKVTNPRISVVFFTI